MQDYRIVHSITSPGYKHHTIERMSVLPNTIQLEVKYDTTIRLFNSVSTSITYHQFNELCAQNIPPYCNPLDQCDVQNRIKYTYDDDSNDGDNNVSIKSDTELNTGMCILLMVYTTQYML